jgi:hypothetical protein
MEIDRSIVSGNQIPPGADSQAGGLYLQGLQLAISDSTIANNAASSTGGAFIWTNPGSQTLDMINTTVAGNHARTGLGAGLSINNDITGQLHHVTIAYNSNEGPTSFASAISGGAGVSITNSIIADNTKVFIWENTSCNVTHSGSGSVQWPDTNAGGQTELACAGVSFFDPQLGMLADNGGPTPTILPGAVNDTATGCPPTDQRGAPRSTPCTPGAVELPAQ